MFGLAEAGDIVALLKERVCLAASLGPPEAWPPALAIAVSPMLGAQQPVAMVWGPTPTFLYNATDFPIVGTKHPDAFGRPLSEVWAKIWETYHPIVRATLAGEAQHFVDRAIVLSGRPRPVGYVTFSFTPLRDETGAVAGFYCVATEITDRVLLERRRAAEAERQRKPFDAGPGVHGHPRRPAACLHVRQRRPPASRGGT